MAAAASRCPRPPPPRAGSGSKDLVEGHFTHASAGIKLKFGSEDYVCEELRLEKDDLTAIVQELRPWVEELEHFVESDGCGHLCALTTLSERALAGNYEVNAFNRCVEVVGDNSGYTIDIAAGVSCAKVLVKSGGIIDGIGASSRVPFARST